MRSFHILIVASLVSAVIVALSAVLLLIGEVRETLPDIRPTDLFSAEQSMVFSDRYNQELFRFHAKEDRTWVSLSTLPPYVWQAFVAIEDRRFFSRSCIDVRALMRAAIANISRYKSEGASTLTQQLVRTVYLDRSKTIERKIREILLACDVESLQTKEEILEQYLNWISFGNGIAGIEQASRRFFGVASADLTLAQSAVLAAMPQRPTYFSPYGEHRFSRVLQGAATGTLMAPAFEIGLLGAEIEAQGVKTHIPGRSDIVLDALLDQHYISTDEYEIAKKRLRGISFLPKKIPIEAPHFILSLKPEIDELLRKNKGSSGSSVVRITTTLDSALQHIAERTIQDRAPWVEQTTNAKNIALLALDRRTNEVLAYVGNTDFFDTAHSGQVDILTTPRAVGSTLKPFVYAMLFEQGQNPESPILDMPLDTDIYRPGHTGYYGRMTIRTALARSRNTPAIRAFYDAGGEDAVLEILRRSGILSPLQRRQDAEKSGTFFRYSWTLVLGAAEASPFELAQGFSLFAHDGIKRPLTSIRSLGDGRGRSFFLPQEKEERVFLTSTAREIDAVLRDEEAREPDWRSIMRLPYGSAAIKTGTATVCAYRDFFGACRILLPVSDWTVGYDDDLLVVVWVGNVDHSAMFRDAASIMVATPIWQEFMIRAHAYLHPDE